MKERLYRRDGLLCAVLMSACLLLAHPFAEMGFVDDWSYIKTAQVFAQTGRIVYNGWATAMLGWQIPWGALFSKLLGFSFVHVSLSTLPIAAASVYVFHQILVRFGISRWHAVFGTLTLALSPLFLPLAASYMTDIPGLFCILLCLYLCQRALYAGAEYAALGWLSLAAVTNILGGTVRQVVWLGVLVMIPSTAWLLRRMRKVFWGGALLWAAGVISVIAFMHWLNQQPYFSPANILPPITAATLIHTVALQVINSARALLCVLVLVLPVLIAWLSLIRSVPRRPLLWGCVSLSIFLVAFLIYCAKTGQLDAVIAPFLGHVIRTIGMPANLPQPGPFPYRGIRIIVTVLVLESALVFSLELHCRLRSLHASRTDKASWHQVVWLLLPFSVVYMGALILQAASKGPLFDRYLLPLQAVAIIFLLGHSKALVGPIAAEEKPGLGIGQFPVISQLALLAFGYYAVAGTHDWFAVNRARLQAAEQVCRAGVPRTAIQAGLEYDGWTQLEVDGYMNNPDIRHPPDAYHPVSVSSDSRPACARIWFDEATFMPAVKPYYFVVHAPLGCLRPTSFPSITYRTWLPPFTRRLYVERRSDELLRRGKQQ